MTDDLLPVQPADDLTPLDDGLSYRERLFVAAYTGEAKGNATKAAQIAGYGNTPGSSQVQGSVLLSKPIIRACVRARALAVMSEHETVQHLADYIRNPPVNPIERAAWVRAIENMMKLHGMLSERVEHSGTIEQQVKQLIVHCHTDIPKIEQ